MLTVLLTLLPSLGFAGTSNEVFVPTPVAGHPVFELRVGAQSVGGDHPTFCGEGRPTAWLAIEACGTGSGILHQSPGADMAHFRAKLRALSATKGRMSSELLLGAGFAEVQRTLDEPGFKFGKPTDTTAVEAAGPEAAITGQARAWTSPHTYVVGDVSAGAAYIPGAPQVMGTQSALLPFVGASVGLGF